MAERVRKAGVRNRQQSFESFALLAVMKVFLLCYN
jgi:hypothetical protein